MLCKWCLHISYKACTVLLYWKPKQIGQMLFSFEDFFILKKRFSRKNERDGRNYMLSKQIRKEWSHRVEPSMQK